MISYRILLVCVVCVLLAGCAGNKIAGRKRERPAAYAELPAAQQRLVDEGRIDVGMSTNAVYVAWGKPARTVAATAPGTFTWLYDCRQMAPSRAWKYRREHARSVIYSTVDRVVYYVPTTDECAEVNFEGNVVKSWRALPPPPD